MTTPHNTAQRRRRIVAWMRVRWGLSLADAKANLQREILRATELADGADDEGAPYGVARYHRQRAENLREALRLVEGSRGAE